MSIMWAESITPRIIFSIAAAAAERYYLSTAKITSLGLLLDAAAHNSPLEEKNAHNNSKLAAFSTRSAAVSLMVSNDTITLVPILTS